MGRYSVSSQMLDWKPLLLEASDFTCSCPSWLAWGSLTVTENKWYNQGLSLDFLSLTIIVTTNI